MVKVTNLFIFLIAILFYSCSNNKPSNDIKPSSNEVAVEEVAVQSEEVEQSIISQPQQIEYETYINSRYGYSIPYPTFLTPQPEAYNGDGRVFTNGNGEEMRVYAMENVLESTIQELKEMQEEIIDGSVDYSVLKKNWFVISGIHSNGSIYYMKTILSDDIEYSVQITYPKEKKEFYNAIVEKVTKSFYVE